MRGSLMKKILLVLISVFLFWGCEGNGAQSVSNSEKSSSVKDYSYSIGYDISKGFKDMSVDIDVNSLKQGLVDGYQGKSKFSDEDDIINEYKFFDASASYRANEESKFEFEIKANNLLNTSSQSQSSTSNILVSQ